MDSRNVVVCDNGTGVRARPLPDLLLPAPLSHSLLDPLTGVLLFRILAEFLESSPAKSTSACSGPGLRVGP